MPNNQQRRHPAEDLRHGRVFRDRQTGEQVEVHGNPCTPQGRPVVDQIQDRR